MRIRRIVLLAAMVLILAGCGTHGNKDSLNLQNRARMSVENGTSRTYPRAGDYRTTDAAKEFDEKEARSDSRAQKIANAVTALASIDKASVVVTGNTAIVGIEMAAELNDENLIKAKEEVSDAVKKIDGTIDHVSVTASDELIKRINGMSDSASGRKVPDYNDRMKKIVSELTPKV